MSDDNRSSKSGSASEEEEGQFEVEKILDLKVNARKKQREFKVRWKGYDSSEDTWEPEDNLSTAQDTLNSFLEERNLPKFSEFDFAEYKRQQSNKKGGKAKGETSRSGGTDRRSRSSKKPQKDESDEGEGDDEEADESDADSNYQSKQKGRKRGKNDERSSKSTAIKSTSKDALEKAVSNRHRIMKGNVPAWLGEDDDEEEHQSDNDEGGNDKIKEKSVEKSKKKSEEKVPTVELDDDESTTQKEQEQNDEETMKKKPTENGVTPEPTNDEEGDMKTADKNKSKVDRATSNDLTAERNKANKSTPSSKRTLPVNGYSTSNKKKKARGSPTSDAGAEGSSSNQHVNLTIISMFTSDEEHHFRVRNNVDLEEVEMRYDEALDVNPRAVAQFLHGIVSLESGYVVSKE